MAAITISRNFKWQKKRIDWKFSMKTSWANTGSWELRVFVEWIVLSAFGSMSTYFLCEKNLPNEAEKWQFPKFESFYFSSNGNAVWSVPTDIFLHSWLITGFVTRITWWVPHVEQELHTFPEHLSSSLVFIGDCVTRSLVFWVMFFRLLFVLLSFFVWPLCCLSFNDSFWLSLRYIQTFFVALAVPE